MNLMDFSNAFRPGEHFVIRVCEGNALLGKYGLFVTSRAGISITHYIDLEDLKGMRAECDRAIAEMEKPNALEP